MVAQTSMALRTLSQPGEPQPVLCCKQTCSVQTFVLASFTLLGLQTCMSTIPLRQGAFYQPWWLSKDRRQLPD
jgi:hypothetical protein